MIVPGSMTDWVQGVLLLGLLAARRRVSREGCERPSVPRRSGSLPPWRKLPRERSQSLTFPSQGVVQ